MILLYIAKKDRYPYFIADTDSGSCTFFSASIPDSIKSYYEKDFRDMKEGFSDMKLDKVKRYCKSQNYQLVCIDISNTITSDPIETENLVFSKYPELLL